MKKILFAAIAAFTLFAFTAASVQAQSTKLVVKTITTPDTTVFSIVPSKIKAFSYAYTETSGTTAGKVYLEGSTISGSWDTLDSLTLSDIGTLQKKTVLITSTNYVNYRWRNTNTSSATAVIKAAWLRRTDD